MFRRSLLRIGRCAVVSFPNFGYWRVRTDLLFRGRSPVSDNLPHAWYESPNIRFFTLTDFMDLLDELDLTAQQIVTIDRKGHARTRRQIGQCKLPSRATTPQLRHRTLYDPYRKPTPAQTRPPQSPVPRDDDQKEQEEARLSEKH